LLSAQSTADGLLRLVGEDDLQRRVQDRITGRGRVTDDEAPRLARVLLTGQVHLVPQSELDQVRAAQPGIDLCRGSRQPAAGIVGDQQQILSKEHAHTLPSLHRSIWRGETFGLVGESGCGKTTIGRVIVGLDRPTSGVINFGGRDLAKVSSREYRRQRRKIHFMFQDSYASLDPRMRAGTILREPLVAQGLGSRGEQRRRVEEMLDHVGLPWQAIERYPHEFSGGQRQRLGFARALTLSPDLIVADEPVSALDVSIQAQMLNLMNDLQRELGLTYLFISHDLAVVRYLSNDIGVMYLGKLVEVGPADKVYGSPAHPYTKGLIIAAPVADPQAEKAKVRAGVAGEVPSAITPPSLCRFRTRARSRRTGARKRSRCCDRSDPRISRPAISR